MADTNHLAPSTSLPNLPAGFHRKLVRIDGTWWLIYVENSLHRWSLKAA